MPLTYHIFKDKLRPVIRAVLFQLEPNYLKHIVVTVNVGEGQQPKTLQYSVEEFEIHLLDYLQCNVGVVLFNRQCYEAGQCSSFDCARAEFHRTQEVESFVERFECVLQIISIMSGGKTILANTYQLVAGGKVRSDKVRRIFVFEFVVGNGKVKQPDYILVPAGLVQNVQRDCD